MKLKNCSEGHLVTTKNAERVLRNNDGLYFNCCECKTSLFLKDKNKKNKPYFCKLIRGEL